MLQAGAQQYALRPRSLGPFFFDRGVRFAAGLAIVVAISGGGTLLLPVSSPERSREDLGGRAAPAEQRHRGVDGARSVEEYLKRPHISVLLRIPQARTEPLDFGWVDPVMKDGLRESPFVESFYLWTERGPKARRWLTYDRNSAHRGAC